MNRAFTNEDADVGDVMIPPRAPLPAGAVNYVTKYGLSLLEDERDVLQKEKTALSNAPKNARDNHDRIRQLTILNGKLGLLNERIASARIIDPASQPPEEVRFGAHVTVRMEPENKTFPVHIVGVDEAGTTPERVAFTSPIAQALTGHGEGDVVTLPGRAWRILEIRY